MKLFEVDDETIGDALVDRSPDIEVELIGVKWIDGNVERFGEALLTKLPDVKVELLGATLLSGVKAETPGKAPGTNVTDVSTEMVLIKRGRVDTKTLDDALLDTLEEEVVELLSIRLEAKTLDDATVDKFAKVEFELVFVRLIDDGVRATSDVLVEKRSEVEAE